MPGMSGYEATQSIRSRTKTRHIPVLMCTAKDKMGDVEKSLSAGATDYIAKPLDIPRFQTKVRKLLGEES